MYDVMKVKKSFAMCMNQGCNGTLKCNFGSDFQSIRSVNCPHKKGEKDNLNCFYFKEILSKTLREYNKNLETFINNLKL